MNEARRGDQRSDDQQSGFHLPDLTNKMHELINTLTSTQTESHRTFCAFNEPPAECQSSADPAIRTVSAFLRWHPCRIHGTTPTQNSSWRTSRVPQIRCDCRKSL